MIDEDQFADEPEVDAQREVVVALDHRRARREQSDALDVWFEHTPPVVIEALLDVLSGKTITPDDGRVAAPFFVRLGEIML